MGECMMPKIGGGGMNIEKCIQASDVSWKSNAITMTFDVSDLNLQSKTEGRYPMTAVATAVGQVSASTMGKPYIKRIAYTLSAAMSWTGSSLDSNRRYGGHGAYYMKYTSGGSSYSSIDPTSGDPATCTISSDKKTLTVAIPMDLSLSYDSGTLDMSNLTFSGLLFTGF